MRVHLARVLSLAAASAGVLLTLGDVAFASECHANCDGGYLAMVGLIGGSLALGSSALGARLGGSALPKRGSVDLDRGASPARDSAAATPVEAPVAPAPSAPVTPDPIVAQQPVVDPDAAIKAGTDYAGRLAKEMAPRGEAMQSGLGIVRSVVTSDDPVAGLADGVTDAAEDQLKDTVRGAVKVTPPAPETVPSPAVGATSKYCPQCGTATRVGGRFCGRCGTKLG